MISTLTIYSVIHCQHLGRLGSMVKRADHQPLHAKAKKIKLLPLCTHGCLLELAQGTFLLLRFINIGIEFFQSHSLTDRLIS